MNDAYMWPKRIVVDYADDRVSISEGTMRHIMLNHPNDATDLDLDTLEQVLVSPDGGVYSNPAQHPQPHRLNYYSAPVDTDEGMVYTRVVVDKVACDPAKVITAYPTDTIGPYGECIHDPVDGGES